MITNLKNTHPEFYKKIIDNLSENFTEEDLFLLEDTVVGANNGKLNKIFGCPFCFLEPVYFNGSGLPSIRNIPLEIPNDVSDKLPLEIKSNILHCPKCKILINLMPKYNTFLLNQ